jgi:hypothetical protein
MCSWWLLSLKKPWSVISAFSLEGEARKYKFSIWGCSTLCQQPSSWGVTGLSTRSPWSPQTSLPKVDHSTSSRCSTRELLGGTWSRGGGTEAGEEALSLPCSMYAALKQGSSVPVSQADASWDLFPNFSRPLFPQKMATWKASMPHFCESSVRWSKKWQWTRPCLELMILLPASAP